MGYFVMGKLQVDGDKGVRILVAGLYWRLMWFT